MMTAPDPDRDADRLLAERFDAQRPRLRALAYRMLGSVAEADDAVQEAWIRASGAGTEGVENLDAWLNTIVSRVCLNALRSRERRREQPLEPHVAEPILSPPTGTSPEQEALLWDSVGMAMLVVLDQLQPAERLAFVLHDLFSVPFDEIGPMLERTPVAARQLASRARRRVRDQAPSPDPDLSRQRTVVDAFFRASRDADFEALVAVLDPDVVLRSDGGAGRPGITQVIHGAENVAGQARLYESLAPHVRPALVNGAAGVVVAVEGRPLSVMAFTVSNGRIAVIDVLADPERLARLDLTVLDD